MALDDDVRKARRVAVAGVVASAGLAAANLVIGSIDHSKAVFATGFEFAGDVIASSIVFLGLTVAVRPADADHPYGHGRVETLAAFVVGLGLVAGGVGICWNAIRGLGEVHPPPTGLAIGVLLVSIAVRSVMSTVKFRVGRRIGSAALVADAWNDAVDILSAATALTAVTLAVWDSARFLAADHYGGFLVGVFVVLMALRVVRDASLDLMDTMPGDELIDEVRSIAGRVDGVSGIDKVRARKTGLRYHVDIHIEVAPSMTVADSHLVAGRVRSRLREEIGPVADVLVHVEPSPGGRGRAPDSIDG